MIASNNTITHPGPFFVQTYDVELDDLKRNDKNRRRREARSMMGVLQQERGNEPLSAIARRVGRPMPAIGPGAERLKLKMARDETIKQRYDGLVSHSDNE